MNRPAAWLADKIADNARAPRAGTCRQCASPILAGLDGDECASRVIVDAAPAGYLAAVAAHLDGRRVVALMHGRLYAVDAALQLMSCGSNGLPLHLHHACPSRPEEDTP